MTAAIEGVTVPEDHPHFALAQAIVELGGVILNPDDLIGLVDLYHRLAPSTQGERAPFMARLAAAMAESAEVTKSSTNTEQNYKYASAESILGAVRGPLFAAGIVLTQEVTSVGEQEITSRSGSKGSKIVVEVTFTFRDGYGPDVLTITGWKGVGQDYGDKAIGKAYTNAIKTFIRSQWLLPTEHDDPEASPSGERVSNAQVEVLPWQKPVTTERKRELRDALAPFFGADVVAAVGKAFANPDTGYGLVPDGFVAFAKALVDTKAAFDARAAAATQDKTAEAGDPPAPEPEPDPPSPEPTPDVEPEEDPAIAEAMAWAQSAAYESLKSVAKAKTGPGGADPNRVAAAQAELNRRDLEEAELAAAAQAEPESAEDVPMPGTVDPPELPKDPAKAVGVLRAAGCICTQPIGDDAVKDDACPIKGHGLPF